MTVSAKNRLHKEFTTQIEVIGKKRRAIKNGKDMNAIYAALEAGYGLIKLDTDKRSKNLFLYLKNNAYGAPSKGRNPYIKIAKLCLGEKVSKTPMSRYGVALRMAVTESWPYDKFKTRLKVRGVNKIAKKSSQKISKLHPENNPKKCYEEGLKELRNLPDKYTVELRAIPKRSKRFIFLVQYKKGDLTAKVKYIEHDSKIIGQIIRNIGRKQFQEDLE